MNSALNIALVASIITLFAIPAFPADQERRDARKLERQLERISHRVHKQISEDKNAVKGNAATRLMELQDKYYEQNGVQWQGQFAPDNSD